MNNPYSLTFGKLPSELIRRTEQSDTVINAFLSEAPSQQVFMITGIRGSGKTVFMTDVSRGIKNHDEWIIVELNPEQDLFNSLAAKLSSEAASCGAVQTDKYQFILLGIWSCCRRNTANNRYRDCAHKNARSIIMNVGNRSCQHIQQSEQHINYR